MPITLSIVIPAYNEAACIRETTEAYYSALSKSSAIKKWEIILVSNNCSDETPQICMELAKKKNIRQVNIPYFIGKGGAVVEGFRIAKYEWLGFVDADNSTEPREFLKLIPETQNPSVGAVIASRKMKDSIFDPPQPFFRQLLGEIFGWARELLFDLKIGDSQCGAKIFRRNAILPLHLHEKKFAFDVELLYKVKRNGLEITEKGIVWKDKKGSKVSWKTPFEMFWALLRIRWAY